MTHDPCTEAQMLIRKPVAEVFNAFIDPSVTTHFWFTKSSGKLVQGQTIKWHWEMYDASANVVVKQILAGQCIEIEWGDGTPRTVQFNFRKLTDATTYVTIREYGYTESGDDLLRVIKDSTGGFTTVLDGLKAYLEHGIDLNLIRDKFASSAS
jgi:uncharacterized protein YndB with AHSA1/START domain